MIYLRLFTAFMKIGFTSFGGMSMIPVIMQEMKVNQWMTAEDLTNLIAIAEMTPGPLGINCATFAGMQTAGGSGWDCSGYGRADASLYADAWRSGVLCKVPWQ